MKNETLKEIKDDISRAKLQGLQESVDVLDAGILQIQNGLMQQQGVASVLPIIINRIMADCRDVNAEVDAENMTPEEAKIRINEITKVSNIIRGYLEETKVQIHSMNGEMKGLDKGIQNIAKKFDVEAAKYLRWERQQEEEEQERIEEQPATTKKASTRSQGKNVAPKPKKVAPKPKATKK